MLNAFVCHYKAPNNQCDLWLIDLIASSSAKLSDFIYIDVFDFDNANKKM